MLEAAVPLVPNRVLAELADTLAGFDASPMNYLSVRGGTPQPLVDKLYLAADKALQSPKVRESFSVQGIEEKRGGPADLGAYLTRELARWGEIVKLSTPTK